MSAYGGGLVIDDGLILYYDAKNIKSAKSGSYPIACNDLIGDNNAVCYATYSADGYFEFNDDPSYIQQDTAIPFSPSSSWTFSQWHYEKTSEAWQAFCGTNIAGPGGYFYYAPTLRYYQDYYDAGSGLKYWGIMGSHISGSDPFTFIPEIVTKFVNWSKY